MQNEIEYIDNYSIYKRKQFDDLKYFIPRRILNISVDKEEKLYVPLKMIMQEDIKEIKNYLQSLK